jgi:4-hydroxyphenylpyruvate dioxygenase
LLEVHLSHVYPTVAERQEQIAFPEINGLHHLGLYVGDARQAAYYYQKAFGFEPIAFMGLETGVRDQTSIVLRQGHVLLALASGLAPGSDASNHTYMHGDGVKEIAFSVPDAGQAFEAAVRRGANQALRPTEYSSENGTIRKSSVAGCGYLVHSFIEAGQYGGAFLPPYRSLRAAAQESATGIVAIDHIAFGVEKSQLDSWSGYYEKVFGFRVSHREDVATEHSAMISRVLQNDLGTVKFPMMEPAAGAGRSQIEEYLEYNSGSGVQHLAFLSDDIFKTVRVLKANGVEFLPTPDAYYDMLEKRVGRVNEDLGRLRELDILVDRDDSGYLLQTFTKPLQCRPTLFIEIIQRKGAAGFGGGNIRALFEAVEREQALRGNL